MSHKYLSIFTIFLFLGCAKNSSSEIEGSIYGSWKLVNWYNEVPIDINGDGQESTNLFAQWNGCRKESIITLNDDGTSLMVYTGADNNVNCPPDFRTGDSLGNFSWQFEEDPATDIKSLVFVGDDYLDAYQIIELTKTKLIIERAGHWTCCDSSISYYTGGFLEFKRQ